MADLLNIGISGLLANQQALTTTSHNISNVNTAGYSRQSVEMATRTPHITGAGYFGQGVEVGNVQRSYNAFLVENLRSNVSSYSRLDTYSQLASQVDNVLADPNAGLTPVLQDFFDAVQGVADNPSSVAARQVMVSSGEALAQRFQTLDERFSSLGDRVNRQMEASVGVVNELARSIADLNTQISRFSGAAGGRQPNDLLDKRDLLLQQLAEHVPVKSVEQGDGAVNVFIGTGQALVIGSNASQLSLRSSEFPEMPKRIYLTGSHGKGSGIDVTAAINGGSLGGSLEFVANVLEPTRASLGRTAMALTEAFNAQHQLGKDMLGQLGQEFFSDLGRVPALNSTDNASTTTMEFAADITDVAKLGTSDFRLDYDGVNYTLTRLSDSAVVGGPAATATFDLTATDGFAVAVTTAGAIAAGDSFLFRPVATAAASIGMQLTDPNRIAVAGALLAQEASDGNGYPTNTGNGSLTELAYTNGTAVLANWPSAGISLQFNDAGTGATGDDYYQLTYPGTWAGAELLDADGTVISSVAPPLNLDIPYDSATNAGDTYYVRLTDDSGEQIDLNFKLNGVPSLNDELFVVENGLAPADNRNALAMAGLQTGKILLDGTTSLQAAYSGIVSDVGTKTHQAQVGAEAQLTLKRQAEEAKESVSGVNLDEEAANLIKFQQAYQATAQVISTANSLFDTLLATVR